jgi:hypothetical protein
MLENKLHISNKSSVAIKLSLLVAILIASALFIANVVPTFANGPVATIWTTDSNGELKIEFVHDDTIYISGEGFTQSSNVNIKVFEPDTTERCSGIVITDSLGAFDYTQFSCKLNGKEGIYTVTAIDTQGITAEYEFSEPDVTYTVESYSDNTYTTVKNNFIQGETVYGKATRSSAANMRLRYRNPSNTVVLTCPYSNSNVVYCDYTLPSGAPVGEWDIQIGRCDNSCGNINNWDWTHGTDHFNVAATPTNPEICNDQIDNDGDGKIDCVDSDCKPCITIFSDKIICNSEDDLPNWSGTSTYIDANTAQNYVNAHPNDCEVASDWYFQWIFGGTNPGDNLEYAAGWNTFGPTNANGRTSVVINKADSRLWFREALKPGYLQFSGVGGSDVTAEFYCDGDVLNYDNYDNLDGQPITDGDTFYCVAFNVKDCTSNADCSSLNTACADGFCNAQNLCEQRLKPAQTECRAAAGMCDVAEVCDGQSATCPADSFQPNSLLCRPAPDVCDAEEYCTGSSAYCPSDDVQPPATKVCRPSAGICDVADYCDGKSLYCPTDVFKSSTEVCRASAGECDLTEYCTGSNADCPFVDAKSTALCRQAAGQCDAGEYCDGINDVCPDDVKSPLSTPCDDGLYCSATDHCDGNGNCVKLTDRDCSGNDTTEIATCDNIPDQIHFTWDFRNAFTSVCDENKDVCTRGDSTTTHTCDKVQCGAECDAQNLCNNKCVSNVFYADGQCQGDCTCSYSQQNCDDQIACTIDSCDPVTGCSHTPDNSLCDDKDSCTIDTCDVNKGCVNTFSDTIGPTTSDLLVDPYYNNGVFNVTGLATDTCSNIKKSEYFVGRGLGSCGFVGTGTPMDPTDGNFDNKIENIKKNNVQYLYDGLNYICIQSQDFADNWGNCACAYYDTDIIPPECPYDIYLDKTLYPNEYLVCGNNAWINATICDEQSPIQGGEYFLDTKIPPIPAPWSGIWMNVLSSFARPSDNHNCAVIGALVDTSKLTDGTHYIKLRGKDSVENWGKIDSCMNVSFIRDTTSPETAKTLIPSDNKQHECSSDEITGAVLPNGVSLTNGCQFVKGGTQIVLHATDPDPQGTGEHADKTKINWIVWYKVNPEDQWVIDQQGVENENQDVTITLDKDSYHLIEYWSIDACGWEETHHFELDIVDNKSPVTTKTIGEPKISNTAGELYITQQTPIELSCVDQNPHPVDHVTLYARYNVDGGNWVDLLTKDGYVKFTFTEDSVHKLEWYCEDALGNKELTSSETDRVDTTYPETIKTYGQPLVEAVTGGYPKWITSQTPITLTVTDGGAICAIGVDKTYYRYLRVDDEYCSDQSRCQQLPPIDKAWDSASPQLFNIPEDSCHLIEYYTVDKLGNAEPVKKQCVFVDNAPPEIVKTVDTPKHECTLDEKTQYGNPDYGCWYITQNAKITLDCDDVMPHPVDNVVLYYRDYLLGQTAPAYTAAQGGYTEIKKTEDSEHVLEFYCVDALGNSQGTAETPHKEIDIVDTQKPVSQKTVGDPKHTCTEAEAMEYYKTGIPSDGCYFITQNTPIELTCTDGQPHPVDHVNIYYRDYLFGNTPPEFTEVADNHITITKTEDSAHILDWYCIDELGNTESTHTEYDIVDTQAPITSKTVGDPKIQGDGFDWWITKDTPITLTCTDQQPHPVDHEKVYYRYKVDGGQFTNWILYTGTFKFNEDSVHNLEYYCVDELGNTEQTQTEVDKVDTTPPVTTKTYGNPLVTTNGGYPKWITSQTPITLTVTDGGAICAIGVDKTYYRYLRVDDEYCSDQSRCQQLPPIDKAWDSASPQLFNIPEDSCHLIEYYTVDKLGNAEPVKKQCVFVDNAPPVVTKEVGEPKHVCEEGENCDLYITSQTPITLTCTDQLPHPVDNVNIYYRYYIDGETPPAFTQDGSQVTFNIPQDSRHIVDYYCVDALGNTDGTAQSPHSEIDVVDNKAPISSKTFDGTKIPCSELSCANQKDCDYYITQNTKIVLSCSDQQPHPVDHQKIYYRYFVDDVIHQDWIEYTNPIQYNENSKHTLDWYCVDALGNTEQTHTQTERVDSTSPDTTKTVGDPKYGNDNYWVTSQTPITLTTLDKEIPCASGPATLYYTINRDSNCDGIIDIFGEEQSVQTNKDCQLSTTIYLGEECLHEIKWHAVDALGNVETEHTQLHKVDNTPPHVLILKPVDGWYSDGEDIPVVAAAQDLSNTHGPCNGILDERCAVGIEDGRQCNAYLLDILPEFKTVALESHMTYNADAHECQGYVTLNNTGSLIPDGITFLVVSTSDNLNNEGNSLLEIFEAIEAKCTDGPSYLECLGDVVQDIVTIWNLPKIGIDNHAPEVKITQPIEGTLFGGQQVVFSADVTDANDGDVTSTITSGTPCYVTVGGISLGTVPYNNIERKCSGTIMIPQDEDFSQGTQGLKVEIADNAGNIGSDTINVNVDTVLPLLAITMPSNNQFVSGTQLIKFSATDANLDLGLIKVSTDNGQTWKSVSNCGLNLYCYNWDTTLETDGMAYGIIAKATDQAVNTGYSEVVIVIVDNDAPEGVYVLNPIKNDIVQGTITLKALATDYVSGIKGVKIYVLSPVVWNCDATLIGGTWQCSFISTQLLDGAHEVYAVAKDNMDKETISAHVPFIIDNYAPTMPSALIHIPSGNYVTQNTVTWKWQVSSDVGSGLDHYIIDIDGIDYTVSTSPESGFESYTINLLDGNHIARVKAVDKAGHATGWSNLDSLTIDTVSPSALTIYGTNIENPIYDTNGNYNINWNGGTDVNFDRYELYEDSILIYTGGGISLPRISISEGNHEYQIKSYDKAGHVTVSSFFDVFVDKIIPAILTTSQSSWGPVGWWFGYSVNDGIKSSGLLTPTYSGGLNLCSFNPDTKTGSCLVFGNVANITVHVSDKAGHSTELTVKKGSEINTDFTPPELLSSGPSGVISYNIITLTATTDEPSVCKYGTVDDYSTMTSMDGSGTTIHSANLGTLTDGLKVYHVVCEDMAGNKMDSSKTIVFYIDTTGNYNLVIPDYGHYWSTGWNSFFLPEDMLEDICGDGKPYTVEKILKSLDGSDPSYDVLWYFDGADWLYYNPKDPAHSTLTQFNDKNSLPYYIRLVREDRLEITQANCLLSI